METPDTPDQRTPQKNGSFGLSLGVGLGLPLGLILGIITDNLALWLGVGLAFGIGIGIAYDQMRKSASAVPPRVKVLNGATYTLTQRSRPSPGQRSHYWLGDNGQEIELTDEEAAELR